MEMTLTFLIIKFCPKDVTETIKQKRRKDKFFINSSEIKLKKKRKRISKLTYNLLNTCGKRL